MCTYVHTYVCTYILYMYKNLHHKYTQAHTMHAHTNLIKVDVKSCSCGLHSIVQLPQSPQCVGEPHKPDITVDTRTHGTAVTLNGLTRIATVRHYRPAKLNRTHVWPRCRGD